MLSTTCSIIPIANRSKPSAHVLMIGQYGMRIKPKQITNNRTQRRQLMVCWLHFVKIAMQCDVDSLGIHHISGSTRSTIRQRIINPTDRIYNPMIPLKHCDRLHILGGNRVMNNYEPLHKNHSGIVQGACIAPPENLK